MSTPLESYEQHVETIESGLGQHAKRSFEAASQLFVDGAEIHGYYSRQWENPHTSARLIKRTPLQIERDRILHAPITRKLTEKYQVLYDGQRRVVRNYSTHVSRMVQVTRAICRWLDLNGDFAEAIALGSKTGALPFVHASKEAVSSWVQKKIEEIDKEFANQDPKSGPEAVKQLRMTFGEVHLPPWLQALRSETILEKVRTYIPWAAGVGVEVAHSTGQQAYWMLSTNPFSLESSSRSYCPETMFGVWRHTLGAPLGANTFLHEMKLDSATTGYHKISWEHVTYEGIAVAYADDITWVIENLNDADRAALLNGKKGIYEELLADLGSDIPDGLMRGLAQADAGALYTYFISDFNEHSAKVLQSLGDGVRERVALREGRVEAVIGLSPVGEAQLEEIKGFLNRRVFAELRVANRTKMLGVLSEACMDLLYQGVDDILPQYLTVKANIERWSGPQSERALSLLKDPVHRVQLAVDVFCEMGDQEIYDLIGIESL